MYPSSSEVDSVGRNNGSIYSDGCFLCVVYSLPIAVLVPGIGGVIILTALFWAPADHIGNNVARIIVKAIILIIAIMIEFCIVINATLPWLERKTATPPRIRKIDG